MNINRTYRESTIPPEATRVFEGEIFDVYQWEQKLYDGSTATFEKVSRDDTVVVFPVMPDGTIYLIDDEQPGREAYLTAPAGRLEDGEVPEDAARRELKEETGIEAERLDLLYDYAPLRKLDWQIYVYIAHGCRVVTDTHLDPGEKITPHPVTFDELIDLTLAGEYPNDNFSEIVYKAKLDPAAMRDLKQKFAP